MHKTLPPQGLFLATNPRRLLKAAFVLIMLIVIAGCSVQMSSTPSTTGSPIAPALSWSPSVSALMYGSPLTTGVLDAVSNVAGSFVYTTADGQVLSPSTILPAGSYTLYAKFTPDDSQHYTAGSVGISFLVDLSTAGVSWTPSTNTISQGVPLVPAILDALGSVDGSISYTATSAYGTTTSLTNATLLSAGKYTLTATLTPTDNSRYKAGSKSIPFTVFAPPQIVSTTTSAALEQGYNGKFFIDNNGTSYLSIHSADGAGNLNNALVESVGIWNQTSHFSSTYLRNYGPVNVEGSVQGAAAMATNGDGTVHMVWAGSDVPISDTAYADQIHYGRFTSGNPPVVQEETIPFSVDGFTKYYSLPYQREFLWQEHPSFAEDNTGKLYIVFEGRDPSGAPTVTCPAAPAIVAGGAEAFRQSSLPSSNPLPVSVTISPTAVSLLTCATQQFTATVTNSNQFVDWQVNGLVGGNSTTGTISKTGLYTAPATVPTPSRVGITADSQADPKQTATALVTINAPADAPAVLPLESGISLVTRSPDGTYSQSGIITAPPYLGVQGYTTQLRPQIMVQSAAIQHVICTGSGPGIGKQQILYGTISGGIFSGWQPVALSRNDQQNQSAALDSQGQVHLVWREVAQGQNSVVLYSVRNVSGVWSTPVQLSSPSLYADTPNISVDIQVVRVAWVEWKPGFINSNAQVNNGLSQTAIEDTHVVEGTLMFSMKSLGTPNAPFSLPVNIQTGGEVGYPTFARGVPNALAWTSFSSGVGNPTAWSVYLGETP